MEHSEIWQQQEQPKLQINNLSKTFELSARGIKFWRKKQNLLVLDQINLDLYTNEFVSIVGASGCGKSTLLNIIAGLIPPSSGEILLDGEVVVAPGADRGMVFQTSNLFPWLTVANNIGFGHKLQALSPKERQERIRYYLEIIGLTKFANVYPKQLSGGMKQRVAIARALANEPEVLLMDEPFGALDAQTREQMQEFLIDLWEKTQVTVLMITHDVDEAIFLSQRIYIMQSNPGSLQDHLMIDLPEPHHLELKLTPEFITYKRQILAALRQQIKKK